MLGLRVGRSLKFKEKLSQLIVGESRHELFKRTIFLDGDLLRHLPLKYSKVTTMRGTGIILVDLGPDHL